MYIFSLGLNTPYNKIWMRKFEWYRKKNVALYFLGKTGFQDLKCPDIKILSKTRTFISIPGI